MSKQGPILIRNEEEESRQVRRDLVRVIILNSLFLLILLGLYWFNRATGRIDNLFSHLLKF